MAKKRNLSPVWLATFADLMSLLMALFVLLYAMSTLEVPKYKAVVESLTETLGHGKELTPEQEQFFQSLRQQADNQQGEQAAKVVIVEKVVVEDLKPLYESLIETYSASRSSSEIKIEYDTDNDQIKLIFPEQIAFDPGRADLKPQFIVLLRKFYEFRDQQVSIKVIGHTDSRPISGGRFRSNWELSSARAASVIEQLVKDGSIRAEQAQAIGLADTQPISIGTTELDYAKNRRVEVLITDEKSRPK